MPEKQIERLKSIQNNRVVKNAKWMIAEQMVQMLVSLIIGMITARYLGPSNYGVINYCAAYIAFFTAIATLGLEMIIVKELVASPEKEGEILGSAVLMRLGAGFLSVISIMLILFFVDGNNKLILTVGFLQSTVLVFKAFEIFDFWFQARYKSKYSSALKSISYVLVALYKVYILVAGKSVMWFAFSTSLDFLIIAIFLSVAYAKTGGMRLSFSKETSKRLLLQGYHFIISNLIITVYAQIDKVMIKQFMDDTQVGYYSAAIMICTYWVLIPTAIINAARPAIMQQKIDGNDQMYKKRFKQLYAILIWLGIFVSVAVSIFAGLIVRIAYGAAYLPAAGSLIIAIWYTTFATLGVARGNWLACENKNKYAKWFVLIGAIVNVILNAILIPTMGIEGAAIATLVTQICVCFVGPLCFSETRENAKQMAEAFIFKF